MNILATKDDVKLLLDDVTNTDFDALLDALLVGVSRKLELATNRKLFRATYVEIHHGGQTQIYVNAPPIASVTSVIYAPDMLFADGTTLGTSEYVLDPSDRHNSIYSTWGRFIGGANALKVTYVGGFDSADAVLPDPNPDDEFLVAVPVEVKDAVAAQVAFMFKNRKSLGLDNITFPDGTMSKVTTRWFLPEVQDVIKALRIKNTH